MVNVFIKTHPVILLSKVLISFHKSVIANLFNLLRSVIARSDCTITTTTFIDATTATSLFCSLFLSLSFCVPRVYLYLANYWIRSKVQIETWCNFWICVHKGHSFYPAFLLRGTLLRRENEEKRVSFMNFFCVYTLNYWTFKTSLHFHIMKWEFWSVYVT